MEYAPLVEELARDILAGTRRVIVVDVEATCWKKDIWSRRKETIEIGAVHYQLGTDLSQWQEFQTFVRPMTLPRLSTFCRELTGITQADVDAAPLFDEAWLRFREWMSPTATVVLASWTHYDVWQLDLDLELHGLPKIKLPHLDVKKLSTRFVGGMSIEKTATALGVESGEARHRAIRDARTTARILDRLLSPPK